jgi:hypothetical protein
MGVTTQTRPDNQTAFQEAFDAMTEWQEEIRSVSERYGEKVLTKLGTAAKSAGWPDAIVDASRDQIQLVNASSTFGVSCRCPSAAPVRHSDSTARRSARRLGGEPTRPG